MGKAAVSIVLTMVAALSPAYLHADEPAFLPCITQFGAPAEFRSSFGGAGWVELTAAEDRLRAAEATGEVQYLVIRMPRRAESPDDLDEMLRRMHRENTRYDDDGRLLYFQRDSAFALVAPAGVLNGSGTHVRCILVGPDLAGAAEAIAAGGNGGAMDDLRLAIDFARLPNTGSPELADLQIDAVEFLFDGTPNEPVYGPLNFIVTYQADAP